jgi:bacteriocin-like protein
MSDLKFSDLNTNSSELLTNTKNVLNQLTETELTAINGGLQLQAEIPVVWPIPTVEPIVCFEPEDM